MSLKVIKQDDTRDRSIRAGRIEYLYDVDAAMQMIDNKVRGQLGEYRYAQTEGVDYSGNIFGADPNYQLFESQVRSNILAYSFVTSIDSFEYEIDSENQTFSYEMTVTTIYGTGTTIYGTGTTIYGTGTTIYGTGTTEVIDDATQPYVLRMTTVYYPLGQNVIGTTTLGL